MTMDAPEDILAFWFPPTDCGDSAASVRQVEWWFRGGANALISTRFRALLERAARGELDG